MTIGLNFTQIGPVALGVILVLLAMSVLSITVMFDRWWFYRAASRQSRRYADELPGLLGRGMPEAISASGRPEVRSSPLAGMALCGLQEWTAQQAAGTVTRDLERSLAAARQALQYGALLRIAELRQRLPILATIGSTAPFVGLFGTTFGIIDAFAGMATTGSPNIGVISAGISEALVTTAFGLVVAVPAVWAYNAFLGRVERFQVELDRGTYVLLSYFERTAG